MRNKKLIIIFTILLTITLLVLQGSIIFSVKHIQTFCHNYPDHNTTKFRDDKTLSEFVLEYSGINAGQSIFFINDKKIAENVERNLAAVSNVEIERKFPNRVIVYYQKMFGYYTMAAGNHNYLMRYDGRIIEESYSPFSQDTIQLRVNTVSSHTVNGNPLSANASEILKEITEAFELLEYDENAATRTFDFIDIKNENNITAPIYLSLRNVGIKIKIEGCANILLKLKSALELYNDTSFDIVNTKMIRVNDTLKAFASITDDYIPSYYQ